MARLPFKSRIITDAGISMGDEGKGRLIYEITEDLKELANDSAPVGVVNSESTVEAASGIPLSNSAVPGAGTVQMP